MTDVQAYRMTLRDRTTVARPADGNNLGPIRARGPEAVAEMRRLAGGGGVHDVDR